MAALRSSSVRRTFSLEEFLIFLLKGIGLRFGAALFGSQSPVDSGLAFPPPRRQQRRVQTFATKQSPDSARAFGLVSLGQDAELIVIGEAVALGLGHDFGVGVSFRVRAGFSVAGPPTENPLGKE